MGLITAQDVYDYLGIDYADEMVERRVGALIATVDSYLAGAVGRDYMVAVGPENIAKAREIGLMLIGELYDTRGLSAKENAVLRTLVQSLLLQLQLDYAEEEGSAEDDL